MNSAFNPLISNMDGGQEGSHGPLSPAGSHVDGNMGTVPTGLFLPQTWTSRCLMKFYAVVAASPTSWESHKVAERIEQRILNSNPIMEAFGKPSVLRTAPPPCLLWNLPPSGQGSRALRPSLCGMENDLSFTALDPQPRLPATLSLLPAVVASLCRPLRLTQADGAEVRERLTQPMSHPSEQLPDGSEKGTCLGMHSNQCLRWHSRCCALLSASIVATCFF